MKRIPTIAVSGGFDPIHKGHVMMIREAAEYGHVIVLLNSDDWLIRKKGYKFMSFEERAFIIGSIKGVVVVSNVADSDETVCAGLRRFQPDYFANGGDRYKTNTPEMDVCEEIGITMLWNIGGGKVQSSSNLVSKAKYGKVVINGQEF
jgi:D-beta-D-heptose 7-phosphate kinase/D-beta-D-heptose 1-phosphate adenosyltransferase